MKNWNWNGTPLTDREPIFVDFDHLLPVRTESDGNQLEPEDLKEQLVKKYGDGFAEIPAEFLAEMKYIWDPGFIRDLSLLNYAERGLILLSTKFRGLTEAQLDAIFDHLLHIRIEDVLDLKENDAKAQAKAVEEYLSMSYDTRKYVLLDSWDIGIYSPKLHGHVIVVKQGDKFGYELEENIVQMLDYGPWWGSQYQMATLPWELKNELIEEEFRKVIFLDVDGVLNDDGIDRKKQVINPEFVKNLAKIVKATGAAIILSSSWKGAVKNYLNYGVNCPDVELLIQQMTLQNGITISGCTPDLASGPDGRPYEIRAWLANRPNVTHFVILDDETFWNWGWLKPHVVCTRKENDNSREPDVCGLNAENVKEAIRILSE